MTASSICMVLAGLLAQPVSSAPPGAEKPVSELIRIVAVRAAVEGRGVPFIEPTLKGFGALLEKLPFDAFYPLAIAEQEAPYGRETAFPINEDYCFHVLPKTWRPEDNELEMDARVELRQNGARVDALAASARVAPGGALLFRGLKLASGELAVIMMLRQRDENQSQDNTSESQPADDQEEEEQDRSSEQAEEQPHDQEEPQPEPQDREDEPAPDEEAPQNEETEMEPVGLSETEGLEAPKDVQNIEAILRSLEEMDRREQQRLRQHLDRTPIRKEWW